MSSKIEVKFTVRINYDPLSVYVLSTHNFDAMVFLFHFPIVRVNVPILICHQLGVLLPKIGEVIGLGLFES